MYLANRSGLPAPTTPAALTGMRMLFPDGRTMLLVEHPQHRPAVGEEHPHPGERRGRGGRGQPGPVRQVHSQRLLLADRAELRGHHGAGPPHRRRHPAQPPLQGGRGGSGRARSLRDLEIPAARGRAALPADDRVRLGPPHQAARRAPPETAAQEPAVSATYAKAGAGRHRGPAANLALPKPPTDEEKYLYVHRNLFFLATTLVIGASTVIISQIDFETHNPLPWPFLVFTVTFFAYQVISLPVNFTGSGFDLAAHELRVRTWNPVWYPSVDIYLPICGEPVPVLRNTWTAVAALVAQYGGLARPYVLDDGDDPQPARLAAGV